VFNEGCLFSKTWNARTSRLAFLRALVSVFEQFQAEGLNPSATYWTTHHGMIEAHIMPRLRAEWAAIVGLDRTKCPMFPWSLDEVGTTWEEWRKTNAQYRDEYRQQLGLIPRVNGD